MILRIMLTHTHTSHTNTHSSLQSHTELIILGVSRSLVGVQVLARTLLHYIQALFIAMINCAVRAGQQFPDKGANAPSKANNFSQPFVALFFLPSFFFTFTESCPKILVDSENCMQLRNKTTQQMPPNVVVCMAHQAARVGLLQIQTYSIISSHFQPSNSVNRAVMKRDPDAKTDVYSVVEFVERYNDTYNSRYRNLVWSNQICPSDMAI